MDWNGTKTIRLKMPHKRGLSFFVLSKINSWESAVAAVAVCWWICPGQSLCQEPFLRSSPKEEGQIRKKNMPEREVQGGGAFFAFFF